MNLEIGAGSGAQPGWLAVDLNPAHADVIASAIRLPFRDGSVDAMRAVDVLEHCSFRETDLVLAEWARVLRSGGGIYVQVPDADKIMRDYTLHPERLRDRVPPELPQTALAGATWRLLGGHADGIYASGDDWRWNAHYALFTTDYLVECLQHAGFAVKEIQTNPHPNLCCEAVRR